MRAKMDENQQLTNNAYQQATTSSNQTNNNMATAGSSNLPDNFLRTSPQQATSPNNNNNNQLQSDAEFARQLQEAENNMRHINNNNSPTHQTVVNPDDSVGYRTIRRLNITIQEAKLNKSYVLIPGMQKMDPYVRVRIGHSMYATPTHTNGDLTPQWNKTIQATLPAGVDEIFVEIFDEKTLSEDLRIAWGIIPLTADILEHKKTVTKEYKLSGETGTDSEGTITLVISQTLYRENVVVRGGRLDPNDLSPAMGNLPPPVQIRDEDIEQISEMFPNIEKDTIRDVLVSKGGDKEMAIGTLLQMT